MANKRRTSRSCNYRNDRNRDRGYKTSRDSDYKHDKSERKAPPEFSGKPCYVHGDKAKHTYEECRDNPKNLKSSSGNRDDNNRKRNYDAHYHDKRYLSSQDESPDDHRTPEPSDQAAETASATKKLVKYLKKRGRSVWSKGPHLVRRTSEMRSHLVPQSM